MRGVAIGGAVFATAFAVEVFGLVMTFFGSTEVREERAIARPSSAVVEDARAVAAWTGPIAIVVLVVLMTGATIGAFELMHALPITTSGGAGHGH